MQGDRAGDAPASATPAPEAQSATPAPEAQSATPPWLPGALLATKKLLGSVEPPLSRRLARVFERIAGMNGGRSLEASLSAAATTPGLALMDALREDVGLAADDPRFVAVAGGAILLYAYVRLQDDLVDEPEAWDRGDVFTAEVLASASARELARAVDAIEVGGGTSESGGGRRGAGTAGRSGGAAFFAFREEVMRSFAEVAAWELDVYRKADEGALRERHEDTAWLGRKLLPMAVPLGALVVAAGREADLPEVVRFVVALGEGIQLVNDVLNAAEDHVSRRPTPVLRWLYEGGRAREGDGAAKIRALLLSDAALDRALDKARRATARAEDIALQMGAARTAAVARERASFLDTVPERLLALCLKGGAL
jgi:hypothetical protein